MVNCTRKISYDHCNCYDQFESTSIDLNGKYTRFCKGKKVEEGEFKNGNKNGIWTLWALNGQVLDKIRYNNGILDGQFELYFGNGTPKFSGTFVNGKGNGQWNYFNSKGKIIKTGKYDNGKAIGIWQIFDEKGKKIISSYNYDTMTPIVNSDVNYYKNGEIIQDDFNGEYFILMFPDKIVSKSEQPLGGYKLARDYFASLVTIPQIFWDTYTNYHYRVGYTFSNSTLTSIELKNIEPQKWDYSKETSLPYLIVTNPTEKIRRIKHKEISIRLLETKILETLHLIGPWTNMPENSKIEIIVPYVVNEIKNYDGR